jgi:hypothetical protein
MVFVYGMSIIFCSMKKIRRLLLDFVTQYLHLNLYQYIYIMFHRRWGRLRFIKKKMKLP